MINNISVIILPLIIVIIITYALKKKINIYDSFIKGCYDGLKNTLNITPHILAMVFAVNILIKSDFFDLIANIINPINMLFNIPKEIIPMALLRPVSGGASLAIMNDIFINHGPDSYVGRLASTIQGCTDTTLYVIALYFGSVRIKKIRYSLIVGLISDLIGIISSFIIVNLIFT